MSFRIDQLAVLNLATVGNSITAGSFVKSGGTSSQFLKADGTVDTNAYITGITSGMVTTALGYTPVPNTRNITINGVTQDLSVDRTWTISAGVSSVTGSGSGISVSPTTGAVVISNTGVTSNVAGTGISVSGATGAVTITNTGVTSIVAGTAITISGATGAVTINNTGVTSLNGSTGALTGFATQAWVTSQGYITSASVGNGTLTLNVSGNGLSGSQTFTANQSTAATFTVTSNATTAATANTLVYRDASGHITGNYGFFAYVNTSDNDETGITRFVIKNGDNYHRSATTTTAMTVIRGVASGTWGISITGSAGSASTASQVTHNASRTDGTWYNIGWFAGNPSPAYSCDSVQILSSAGAIRANIYYDNDNTAYYLNPASGSTSLRIAGGIAQNDIVGRPAAYWGSTGTTGAVVIKFPGNTGNYGMIHAVIDIYEYNGNDACTVIVGGHNWGGAWYNYGAQVVGSTDKPVRVGVKDGQYCIVIGNGSSSWSYGQVVLRKIQNGTYYSGVMDIAGGYTVAIESDTYSWISSDLRNLETPLNFYAGSNIYMGGNIVATQSWVNSQGFVTGGPFVPVSGGVNMTGSYGLNDSRLYLRTNGDTNHYLWNAGDDWEELGAYAGTGFRVTSNNGANGLLYVYGSSNGGYTYSPYSFRAPIFYDSDDTSYYADFHSTSQSAIRVRGGALHGPNPTWGKYLLVGGDGRQGYIDNTDVASVSTTNGNLHIDAASGYGTYINWYDGSELYFGRGNSGAASAFVNSSGNWNFGNTSSASYLIHARGDIYADGGWVRVSGTSGLYFESYAGGWHMTDSTYVRSYNGKNVHMNSANIDYVGSIYFNSGPATGYLLGNTGGSYGSLQINGAKNGWYGLNFESGNTLMMNNNESGHHQQGVGWKWRWYNGQLYVSRGSTGGGTEYTVWDSGNAPRAGNSLLMYYQGFTLDANTMDGNSSGFTYSNNAPFTGPVIRISETGYSLWFNAAYSGGGTQLAFRTRNGDSATLNPWRTILHDANYNSYSPTLTGGGASGTWSINITGGAGSANLASQVTINYNNDSNSTYQLLWGSGNSVYGTSQVYVNPSSDVIYARGGYISPGNAWGTADSAFFPNGITTAGSTNWVYGRTYIGNAPGNGSGVDISSVGSSYFLSGNTSGTWGYAGQFVDRNNAANNYIPWSFESEYGNHSWGIVARFHIQQSGADKPAIQFTATGSNERWSLGYCTGSDYNFRITQNQAYRTDNSGQDGWGTERFRINTDGTTYLGIQGQIVYFNGAESANLYGIRGRFTNEYMHLYNKVGVGHPGGWGQGEGSTPNQGLSTYGGANFAYGTGATSTFYGHLRVTGNNNLYLDSNYGQSIIGVYASTRYQGVFAMGDAYKLPIDGTGPGNLYGLAWSHPNAGGVAGNLNTHGLLVLENGTFLAAISGSIRARDDMRAPIFYDSDNTGYYLNPAGTSNLYAISNYTRQGAFNMGRENTVRRDITSDQNYWGGAWGWGTGYGTWADAWKTGFSSWDIWGTSTDHPQGSGYVHAQGIISGQHYCTSDGSSAYGWMMVGAHAATENRYWLRGKWGGSTSGWVEMITSGNIGSQNVNYATTAGTASFASNSGNTNSVSNATGGSYTWTGQQYFQSNLGGYCGSLSGPPLQAYSTSNNSAFFSFHKGGYYAVNMGLDADSVLRIGGWSASANRWQLDMSGNMTVAGDVTAYSDARVKENIETVEDALDKVLNLRGVYYNRTDSEDKRRKVGVIAQEILEVIPEVVAQDNAGMYNVSYGNIVGVLIEAIKEQNEIIKTLKSEIDQLKAKLE